MNPPLYSSAVLCGQEERVDRAGLFLLLSVQKQRFEPNLENREGVCPLNPNWEPVPQKGRLITGGSASHSTL